jgi:RimJ/RimL family protein N-acetyltransferase
MSSLRRVEVYITGLEFTEVHFHELKMGDTFRLYEPTGEPVLWDEEQNYYATSDAYEKWFEADQWNSEGYRWTIDCIKERDKGELIHDSI